MGLDYRPVKLMAGQAQDNSILLTDGSVDFSGGVDSLKVTTIASQQNPGGLARNELAWLDNATVRDGGILSRTGWQYCQTLFNASKFYQGGGVYEPDFDTPYLLLSVSGHIYKVIIPAPGGAFPPPIDLSASFANTTNRNDATTAKAVFCQGEQFMIIQAGDLGQVAVPTLPLFWDGNKLFRSKGITNTAVAPGTPGVNQIPAGLSMDYFMGRLWYAQGRQANAGDIVFGPSGTGGPGGYGLRDAILNVTENPLVVGGDGFSVPSNAGNIRAIFHNANLNAQLGQGQLLVGTRKAIYNLNVPVTRNDWIAANNSNQPLMTVVQINNGPVNDRSVVKVNGDVFMQTLEPAIRPMSAATRDFSQWANTEISSNIQRVLSFNDRALLQFSSGCLFDNRLLQTCLPTNTPQGVVHPALAVLDFMPISSFGQNLYPIWEGIYEGLSFLQLFTMDWNGLERCFAVVVSTVDNSIQLYELTTFERSDFNASKTAADPDGESRVTWIAETPAYTFGNEFILKRLETLELWFDKIFGEVIFKVEWRPDSDPCWKLWHQWKHCFARNSCEDVNNPVCYPIAPFREGFRATDTLPRPPKNCESAMGRPAHIGYQFQLRITVKGWCRIRGLRLFATQFDQKTFHNKVC